MPDDIASGLFSRYQQQTEGLNKLSQANTDAITKMLTNQTVTPTNMMDVAHQAMRPVTGYEVSRGVVRPSVSEVLRASRASDMKYNMDVSGLINTGMDNSAHEMQLVINAMNAQTAAGNTQIAPINNVMKSILPTLSPEEGVLFSRAYLGRVGEASDLTDQGAWGAAADVLNDLKPKGKVPPMKVYNSQGDLVVVDPMAKTADKVYNADPKATGSTRQPQSKLVYTEETVTMPDGSMTTVKKPVAEYVPGQGTTGYVSPGVTVTPPTGGGQTPSLTSTKVTPSADLKQSPEEASKLGVVQTSLSSAQQLRDMLMPNGVVDPVKVRQMATGIGGGQLQALYQQAASGIRHTLYGSALTEQEVTNFAEGFKPGMFDKENTVKQKVDGLISLLSKDVQSRQAARKPSGAPTSAKPKDDWASRQIENAKAAIAKGIDKNKVIELLKSKGVDTSGL